MINRIVASLFFICLLMAISIKLIGLAQGIDITHIELGTPFLAFMKNTSLELERYKIAIPNIPAIPDVERVNGFMTVVSILSKFLNGIVNLLNFIVLVLNTIIQLIEFLFLLLKNLITFRDTLVGQA